jgi:hypothetical protein
MVPCPDLLPPEKGKARKAIGQSAKAPTKVGNERSIRGLAGANHPPQSRASVACFFSSLWGGWPRARRRRLGRPSRVFFFSSPRCKQGVAFFILLLASLRAEQGRHICISMRPPFNTHGFSPFGLARHISPSSDGALPGPILTRPPSLVPLRGGEGGHVGSFFAHFPDQTRTNNPHTTLYSELAGSRVAQAFDSSTPCFCPLLAYRHDISFTISPTGGQIINTMGSTQCPKTHGSIMGTNAAHMEMQTGEGEWWRWGWRCVGGVLGGDHCGCTQSTESFGLISHLWVLPISSPSPPPRRRYRAPSRSRVGEMAASAHRGGDGRLSSRR